MNDISHKRAIQLINRRTDGLLNESQLLALDEHLHSCDSCRAYASNMDGLSAHLQNEFHRRWDAQLSPSQKVFEHVTTRASKIPMANRLSSGVKLLAGAMALLVLGIAINFVVSRLQSTSPVTNATETVNAEDRMLAFASEQNGNSDIYTMRADGGGMTNLTINSASDHSPIWSRDGKRIFFISERTGNTDIFSMDPDGSHLIQLTDNPGYDGFFSLSPNGEKIIYSSSVDNDPNFASLMIMNADGSNKMGLAEAGSYIFLGWSPDGQKFVYQKQNLEEIQNNEIHVTDIDGMNHHEWTAIIDEIKWEDEQHFIGYGWSGVSEPPSWKLYRFDTNGIHPIEIAVHNSRIAALFQNTYIAEGATTLSWYSPNGNPTLLKSWIFTAHCKKRGDQFLQETGHTISPSGAHAFVTVHCPDGPTWFYYENADGSEFKQLTDFAEKIAYVGDQAWSPDAKYVIISITNQENSKTDLYLFDIEKMLEDPSTEPIRLTMDEAIKYEAVWQPSP